ncbi:hypothetical protein HYALB_00001134 [Hymenoscyphus albidus]|uniref:Flavoprotein domain-containing protein n=1 Tax=Hymenoscyphus albidus TaxID=595503 RepID=A0A9N9LFY2_9HELO|nr:hypothetical protein HYALB_00001134 [Hymenoscyphus albidus]
MEQTLTQNPPFTAATHNDGKKHLLLAASGSVATIKIPLILQALSHHPSLSILLILTNSATNFLAGQSSEQPTLQSLRDIPNVDGIFLDKDEWVHPWKRGGGVLHIELRRWADILVIAPLSANTMAKVVGGMADNLLTSVVRAWDASGLVEQAASGGELRRKRILVAPAMNTAMWRHPITKSQLKILEEEWGVDVEGGWFEVLTPQEKELACGDVGDGAMREWKEVTEIIEQRLSLGR